MVCTPKTDLENKVFESFLDNYSNGQYLADRAIMSSTNDTIHKCNCEMIEKIAGEIVISESIDICVEDDDVAKYESEILNKMNASEMPPHRLSLKKGACIILIGNLSIKDGHCNGSRYIILNVCKHVIHARLLGCDRNSENFIPRIPIISKEPNFLSVLRSLQCLFLLVNPPCFAKMAGTANPTSCLPSQ